MDATTPPAQTADQDRAAPRPEAGWWAHGRRGWPAALLLAAAGALYFFTLDNGLQPYQLLGGDLITHQYAQALGRFSNAPGYPLYTMGGWLWFHLGRLILGAGSNPVAILSGYSTVWALVALWLLYRLVLEATDHGRGGNRTAAFLVSAFYAVTYFFWFYAVSSEQYTSAVAWTLAVVWLALRWERTPRDAYLLGIALLAGVALAHMLTLVLILPPLLWFVLSREPGLLRRPRLILAALGLAALPLLAYAFVYLRGAQHPEWRGAGQWRSTWDWFWSFISTRQGLAELTWSWQPFFTSEYPALIWRELTWPGLVAGLLGLALLGRRRAGLLYATLALYLAFCWIDRQGNWYQVIMPAYAIVVLGLGAVADRVWRGRGAGAGISHTYRGRNQHDTELHGPAAESGPADGANVRNRASFCGESGGRRRVPPFFQQTLLCIRAASPRRTWPREKPADAFAVDSSGPDAPAKAARGRRLRAAAVVVGLVVLIGYRAALSYPQANLRNHPGDTGLAPGWAILADEPPPGAAVFGTLAEEQALSYLTEVWGVRPDVRPVSAAQARQMLAAGSPLLAVTTAALPLAAAEISPTLHYSALGPTLVALRPRPALSVPSALPGGRGLLAWHEDFGDGLRLIGGQAAADAAAGGTVVRLAWQATATPSRDYAVSVRLTQGGREIGQVDHHDPVAGAYPTTRWTPGEVVLDAYTFSLPAGAVPDGITVIAYYRDAGGHYVNAHVGRFPMP